MGIALPRLWPTIASGRRLGLYTRVSWPWPFYALFYLVLVTLSLLYGFTFGIMSSLVILPFAAPVVILAMVTIWTMPDLANPPIKTMTSLLTAFIFALLIWPLYIALAIGELPWITAVRLTGLPLMATFFICYVGSPKFRAQLKDILAPTILITRIVLVFIVWVTITLFMSRNIPGSIQQYVIFMYADISVFFVSVYYFSQRNRVRSFAIYLLLISIAHLLCGFYEIKYSHLPWVGHIPSFLQIDDPRISKLLEGSARAATGIYRVQSKFTTSIGLGEFFGLALPFLVHFTVICKNLFMKILIFSVIAISLVLTMATQSRLALVCYGVSIMLYVLFRAILAWRNHPRSLFAPAAALAYPGFLALVLAATFFWHRLSVMIWGGGAEAASTQSRKIQWAMTWPKVLHNPFGYGIGQSGGVLGYIAPGFDMYTVDSYYISVLLDFGVFGFVLFYGMFVVAIAFSGLTALKTKDSDIQFLIAACVSLINFVLSKSVYSETENHPLAFIILGLVVALIRQYKVETGEMPLPLDNSRTMLRSGRGRYTR